MTPLLRLLLSDYVAEARTNLCRAVFF